MTALPLYQTSSLLLPCHCTNVVWHECPSYCSLNGVYVYAMHIITCHVIVFMPLTNPRSPRAVPKFLYCPLCGLILHNIPRHLTFELDHERKCTCKMIFFIILFIFCVHVHVWASLAVTCNKCVIDCGFGQYRTQCTPSRLRRSGVYRTVLPSLQSITHKYTAPVQAIVRVCNE